MNKEAGLTTPEYPSSSDPRPRLIAGKEEELASLHTQLFGDEIWMHMGSLQLLSANEILGIKTPETLKETFTGLNKRVTPAQLLIDAGSARLTGLESSLSDDSKIEILTYLVNFKADLLDRFTSPRGVTHPFRNSLAYAATVGFDPLLTVDERMGLVSHFETSQQVMRKIHQVFMENNPSGVDEDGNSFLDHMKTGFLTRLAQLADARIAGSEISVSNFMKDMMEQAIMADRDTTPLKENAFFPNYAANLAIISAKEVKVGGPRGLELVF